MTTNGTKIFICKPIMAEYLTQWRLYLILSKTLFSENVNSSLVKTVVGGNVKKIYFVACCGIAFLFLAGPAAAQRAGNITDIEAILGEDGRFLSDPLDLMEAELIGLTIPEAFDRYGTPARLFSLRGDEEWQDDVVFFYSDYLYLYWFQDRVWQIRYDSRHSGEVAGLKMGQSLDAVSAIIGPPHYGGTGSLFYDLRDSGFPLRLRLAFKDGRLNDIYIYRSDF